MRSKAFTLVEVLVGTAVFLVVALAAYNAYVALIRLANANQAQILAVELGDEQFEAIRNMPFVNVGLVTGIPLGVLPQNQTLVRGGFTFNVALVIRNINLSTSTVQASSKLVEVDITCPSCQTNFKPVDLTGQVSPANLQSAAAGGALVVQVFNASGQPVVGATVVVQSTATSSVTDTDVTNDSGILQIIGVPPGVNAYRITVSKAGYSTARTYPPGGGGNPNPTSPDATILQGQVTQVSLAIDQTSSLAFDSVNSLCAPQGNLHFNLIGAKQIGAGVPKYSQSLVTGGGGVLNLPTMEWDTYTLQPTDTTYDVSGITPFSPFVLSPNSLQTVQVAVVAHNPNSLLAAVADSSTHLPISGATVQLTNTSGFNQSQVTGQGYFDQTDWSGGSGQNAFSAANKYWTDNGFVDAATSSGNILLKNSFGSYNTSATGTLISSTFDTGTTSNFYSLSWTPSSQPSLAGTIPVKFQFAASPSSTPSSWSFVGPDGTANTYYSAPGMQIASADNGNEFVRYMAYMTTKTATVTPTISDVSFTYTSACIPPGQVLFQGLSTGTYTLTISKSGYTTSTTSVSVASGWQEKAINLGP